MIDLIKNNIADYAEYLGQKPLFVWNRKNTNIYTPISSKGWGNCALPLTHVIGGGVYVVWYKKWILTPFTARWNTAHYSGQMGAVIRLFIQAHTREDRTAGVLSDVDVGRCFSLSWRRQKKLKKIRLKAFALDWEKMFGRDRRRWCGKLLPRLQNFHTFRRIQVLCLGEGSPLLWMIFHLKIGLPEYALQEYEDTSHLRMIQSQALSGLFA